MADKNKLRVGQEIVILTSGFSLNKEPYRIDKITHVGKTQIKTADGSRWMIDNRSIF